MASPFNQLPGAGNATNKNQQPQPGGFLAAIQKQMQRKTSFGADGEITTKAPGLRRIDTIALEAIMQGALKKKIGLDYMSERSGMVESSKFTFEVLQYKLDRYKNKGKRTTMTRDALIEFSAQEYQVAMTMLSATDAILYCRGPQLDASEQYNEEKLIHWLQNTLPAMRKIDDRFQPRREPAKSLNTSQDNFHLFKMSGVGTLKGLRSQRHPNSASMSIDNPNQKLLGQMNNCIKECQKMPALKRKVQETLDTLELSMMDYRAQRGLEASIHARRRLRQKANREEEQKEKSVQIMLEQTAVTYM